MRRSPLVLLVVTSLLAPLVASAGDGGVAPAEETVDAGLVAVDAGTPVEEASASAAPSPAAPLPPDDEPIPVPPPPAHTVADAGTPEPKRPPEPLDLEGGTFAASYREQLSPLEFRVLIGTKDAKARAAEVSALLAAALDSPPVEGAPLATVRLEDGVAVVRVQGRPVAHLYAVDALAAGAPSLSSYAEQLETRLVDFVSAQLTRATMQTFALHVFLSVFIGVLVFLTLRAVRPAFDRWDQILVERGGGLKPISVFKVPVLGGEALRGLLAFGLAVGRALAYAATILVGASAILGQFDATRSVLGRFAARAAEPVVGAVDDVLGASPRLVLVAALVVALRAGLKVAHILLDGVSSGRVKWKPIPPARVPVARALVGIGAVVITAPLLVAIVFGKFGTPLEVLAIGIGGAILLSSLPVVASGLAGIFVLWRGTVRPGEWIEIGEVAGEVTRLSLLEVVLVPESGGTVAVPMLLFALRPVRHIQRVPTLDVDVRIARDRPIAELLEHVRKTVKPAEPDAVVEVADASHGWVLLRVHAPIGRSGVRQALLIAILGAVDRGELALFDERRGSGGTA